MLTIGPKATHYKLHLSEVVETRQQLDVDAFMRQHGWLHIGNKDLDLTGIIQARRYASRACSGEIRILIVDASGDKTGMIDGLAQEGDQLFFLHDGATSEQPPRYAPLRQEIKRVLRNLQTLKGPAHPDLGVAGPLICHIDATLPWSDL